MQKFSRVYTMILLIFTGLVGYVNGSSASTETDSDTSTSTYLNKIWFSLSAQACSNDDSDEDLDINNGYQLTDLSSADLSCTRTNSDGQFVYHITWLGSDFDHDSSNDTLSFDLTVEAFSGSTYVYSATEGASSMTALGSSTTINDSADVNDLDATDLSVWGVDNSDSTDGLVAGQSLRFSAKNIVVSAENYTGELDGFTYIETVETNGGRAHTYIQGQGSDLNSGSFSNTTSSFSFDATDEFVITNSGDYYSTRGWGITDIQFSITISDPDADSTVWDVSDYSIYGTGPIFQSVYPAEETSRQSLFPDFSWDTVPRWLAVRNSSAYSDEQIESIANNYQLVLLEKANQAGFDTVDEGIKDTAARLKAINPNIKTIFYWNTQIHYTGYSSDDEYLENASTWSTLNDDGSIYLFKDRYYWYNESVESLRDWWIDFAVNMANDDNIDGVFIDKMPKAAVNSLFVDDEPVSDYINMISTLSESMPEDKILMGNNLRGERNNGSRAMMELLDGSYLERWNFTYDYSLPAQTTADAISISIQLMREALAQGKFINFQTSPWTDEESPDDYDEKLVYMEKYIDFPLAVFLIAAEKNAFFSYQESVNANDSAGLVWDSSDIEALNHSLGEPLGDPVKNGYVYTRSFEYVDVWVNVETEEATLTWHD